MSDTVREPAIEVAGLTKTYKSGDSVVEAVRGIDLRVEAGEDASASSGPTAPASRPPSRSSARSRDPTAGAARVAGYDVVRERDRCAAASAWCSRSTTLDLLPDRGAEPALPRRALRRRPGRRRAPDRRGAGDGRPGRPPRRHGRDVLRRHEAPAGDRPRPAARAAGAVPGRADDRAGPADPRLDLGVRRTTSASGGDHRLRHHALHGRGRALRPDRDHGRGPDRRAGHARGAQVAHRQGPGADRHGRRRARDRPLPRAVRHRGRRCTRAR